ncbi:hypothetical protein VTN02DRAFT_3705 [Thermoascus thermophilus]
MGAAARVLCRTRLRSQDGGKTHANKPPSPRLGSQPCTTTVVLAGITPPSASRSDSRWRDARVTGLPVLAWAVYAAKDAIRAGIEYDSSSSSSSEHGQDPPCFDGRRREIFQGRGSRLATVAVGGAGHVPGQVETLPWFLRLGIGGMPRGLRVEASAGGRPKGGSTRFWRASESTGGGDDQPAPAPGLALPTW